MDEDKFVRLTCFTCQFENGGSGVKYLTRKQYEEQLDNPNDTWKCPDCGMGGCRFDDDYYESNIENQG